MRCWCREINRLTAPILPARPGFFIDFAINQTKEAVTKLREMSPLWEMFKEGIDLKTIEWAEH